MPIQGFSKPAANGQPAANGPTPRVNPLKGHGLHVPQTPDFPDGFRGVCSIVGARKTRTQDKIIITFHAEDANRDYVWFVAIAGKASDVGYPKIKYLLATALGADSVEEYDAFDPDGYFYDSMFGMTNPYTEQGITAIGRRVMVTVTKGQQMIDPKTNQPKDRWFQEFEFEHIEG